MYNNKAYSNLENHFYCPSYLNMGASSGISSVSTTFKKCLLTPFRTGIYENIEERKYFKYFKLATLKVYF